MKTSSIITLMLFTIFFLPLAVSSPYVEAQQNPSVVAEPSFVNLGMTTAIVVNVSIAGTYTVNITKPDGQNKAQLDYVFASSGELNQTYGNATIGFMSIIDEVGTYRITLQNGSLQVAEATFFATDKLILDLTVADAGTTDNICFLSNQFYRGTSIVPRIYVQYASTGEYMTLGNSPNAKVNFTLPDGTKMNAPFASYLPPKGAWRNCFRPNWNDYAGVWNLSAEASDGKGNYGRTEGFPKTTVGGRLLRFAYEILPAPLTVTGQVLDTSTAKPATNNLTQGEVLRIEAKVEYKHPLGSLGRESATGYQGLLNTTRGGVVTAKIGWGFYNDTSKTFGGTDPSKNPGGLVATITLNYDSTLGLWIGTYNVVGSEPKGDYTLVVDAKDSASPSNSGIGKIAFAPSPQLVEKPVEVEKTIEVIPFWAYGAMAALLVVGLVIGLIFKMRK